MNIIEYSQRPANIVSYVASLPTLAATAWYHKKGQRDGRDLDQFVSDAQTFAKGEYLAALYRGNALPEAERRRIATRLEEFTGISVDWYLANALKITKERYRIELFKDRGLLLGRSDTRYVAPITDKGGAPDPSDVIGNAVADAFPRYIREKLNVTWREPYLFTGPALGLDKWGWGAATSPFQDWPYHLGITKMMNLNPKFSVVVANGFYDTLTTIGAAELLVTQAGWDPARVKLRFYDGGHMGYSVDASARIMAEDIRAWVR